MRFHEVWLLRPDAGSALGWRGPFAFAVVAVAAVTLHAVNGQALDTVRQRDLTVMALGRASHAILMTPYAVLSMLEYDDNTEAGRDAPLLFLDSVRDAQTELDRASLLAPDEAAPIAAFRQRFGRLAEKAQTPLAIGNTTPGLTRGLDLSPADLVALAAGAKSAADTDVQLKALAQDVRNFRDAYTAENLRVVAALKVRSDLAIACMAVISLIALLYFYFAGQRGVLSQLSLRREARRELRSLEEQYGDGGGALSSPVAHGRPASRLLHDREPRNDPSPVDRAPAI